MFSCSNPIRIVRERDTSFFLFLSLSVSVSVSPHHTHLLPLPDDLHRVDAILRTQDPYGGTYERARIATRSFQYELSQPSHALRWFCYEMGYFSRKYGLKRKTKAVEFARAFHHIRAVFRDRLSEGDERTLIHHFTEVSRVLEEEGIVVKEDLSFN